MTNPDGSQIKYEFSQAGFLESVLTKEQSQTNFTTIAANFDYSPTGSVAEIVYPSGIRTVNTYAPDELYRLKRKYTTTGSGAKVIQDFNYTFDAVGNIKRIDDRSDLNSRKILNYFYDDLHRLTNAWATKTGGLRTYRQSFSYDALGNFTNKSDQGAYQYNGNQGTSYANPHAVTAIGAGGATSLSYDRNGNLESVGNQSFYTWDYNNRLRQASANGLIVVYDYTSAGERVSYNNLVSQTISPTKFFSFSTTNGIEKYIFAGNMVLATIKGTGQEAGIYYNHTDHLSGANIVTDESGEIAERLEYYPFGSIMLDSGPFQARRKFAGHEYDLETRLSYMGARYYDGGRARFLSQDPAYLAASVGEAFNKRFGKDFEEYLSDPQELNSYSYAKNNPMKYVDPTGNLSFSWDGLVQGFDNTIYNASNAIKGAYQDTKNLVVGGTSSVALSFGLSGSTILGGYTGVVNAAFGDNNAWVRQLHNYVIEGQEASALLLLENVERTLNPGQNPTLSYEDRKQLANDLVLIVDTADALLGTKDAFTPNVATNKEFLKYTVQTTATINSLTELSVEIEKQNR